MSDYEFLGLYIFILSFVSFLLILFFHLKISMYLLLILELGWEYI